MAGPSVVVRVLGDLKGLGTAMDGAATKGEGTAGRATKAFGGFLSSANATGALGPLGSALEGLNSALDKIAGRGKEVGPAIAGAGAAVLGVGAGLSTLGSKEQAAQQQLKTAIENTGQEYDDYGDKIDEAVKKGERFGKTSAETTSALQVLTQATHDPAKALELLDGTFDLSAAKHIDLASAAGKMGKIFNGNTKLLKEFGLSAGPDAAKAADKLEKAQKAVGDTEEGVAKAQQHLADVQESLKGKTKITIADQHRLRDAQAAVDEATGKAAEAHDKLTVAEGASAAAAGDGKTNIDRLAEVIGGQASASTDTFAGKMGALKAQIEDSVAAFGSKYGPAVQGIGVAVMALGSIWSVVGPAMAAMELASMWPILLIIAALALLGVAIYMIWQNWDEIWTNMKAGADLVWTWLQAGWTQLTEWFGAGIAVLGQFFSDLWNGFTSKVSAVWDWVSSNWPLLLAIITGPIGLAVKFIVDHFETIKGAAGAAVAWVLDKWNGLVDFFTSAPGKIAEMASGMWNGIGDAFRNMINTIIDLWNGLQFTLPEADVFGQHIGGGDIGVPKIPHLSEGGLITRDGLVYTHAGEAITPYGGGPAVHIEQATFATELDVDLFMRRAAWAAQTSRV